MIVRIPKTEFFPKVDFYPKIDLDILAVKLYNEQLGLIKYLASRYTCTLPGYDFNNLVGEGNLAFTNAVKSWRFYPDPVGLKKYTKTSIYHRFFELARTKKSNIREVCDEVGGVKIEVSTADSGFDLLRYGDLVKHTLMNIEGSNHRKVFKLLVDPPEELMSWILISRRRKKKQSAVTGHRVKGSVTCQFSERRVFEYLRETEGMDFSSFNSILSDIRIQVKEMVRIGDFANQTL